MADKKYGRNKKWCERYKQTGQKARNKALKAERAERLTAHFAKRREEGKAYEWKPNPYDKNGSRRERKRWYAESRARAAKNIDHRDDVSKWKSIMRKVQNELDREEIERKKALEGRKTFVGKPHKKKTIAEEAVE